jgi:hypothetical protein
MTRISKLTAALIATVTIGGAVISSTDQASAMMRGERVGMGRMHHGHGHFHRHGHAGFGRAMAVGAGLALVGAVIAANNHRETVARIRYDRAVRQAPKKPPVLVAKPKKECEWVAEWEKLLKSAEATLETDKRMNAEYGEDVKDAAGNVIRTNHSSDHTRFQEAEVERIRKELEKAKEACKKL